MKALCLSLALALLAAPMTHRTLAEPASGEAHPGEVDKLRAEYERRRAETLRPLNAWYQAQLHALELKIEKERQAVEEAKARAADARWEDDQPALKTALLAKGWIWRSERDQEGVEVSFQPEGIVQHVGLTGRWKITGPTEVTIEPADTERYILRFDSGLRSFVGDRQHVTGERKETRATSPPAP